MKKLIVAAIAALALAAAANAAVGLTGYGATRKAWAAHHQPDTNPKLVKGCCYLPRQSDGYDRYYQVDRDEKGRVFTYSMHFAPRISASEAKFILRQTELPRDARLARSKRKGLCLMLQYRSAAAKRALGYATVGAALYSSAAGRYTGKVEDIIISSLMTTSDGC